jgi:hypothetical protein
MCGIWSASEPLSAHGRRAEQMLLRPPGWPAGWPAQAYARSCSLKGSATRARWKRWPPGAAVIWPSRAYASFRLEPHPTTAGSPARRRLAHPYTSTPAVVARRRAPVTPNGHPASAASRSPAYQTDECVRCPMRVPDPDKVRARPKTPLVRIRCHDPHVAAATHADLHPTQQDRSRLGPGLPTSRSRSGSCAGRLIMYR